MHYCDECAEKKLWPIDFSQTVDICQVCGKSAKCSYIPKGCLPASNEQFWTNLQKNDKEDSDGQ